VDYFWGNSLPMAVKNHSAVGSRTKFGLSWQVTPTVLIDMLHDKDPEKAERVMKAMLQMQKIEIPKLKAAYGGK